MEKIIMYPTPADFQKESVDWKEVELQKAGLVIENILVLGSGGREHAIAWKLSQSQGKHIFIAPGNAGTAKVGSNVPIKVTDFEAIKRFCIDQHISMVVVGPEQPLVDGIVDFFHTDDDLKHIKIIGPDKKGAQLEGSKAFAKDFMEKYGIPTAKCFKVKKDNVAEGCAFLETLKAPYVLKADGLAAGKGVLIINDLAEAKTELANMLDGKFGSASATVVIEEFLQGIEASVFVLTDGEHYLVLPEAKDYKRIGEGDKGLNTGGMGAVSPVPFCDATFLQRVEDRIVKPTLKGLQTEGIDYKGFIFLGLMNDNGNPYVIEYNVRMGDPETEVVMPRIDGDLAEMLSACADGRLDEVRYAKNPQTAVTVMMVSGGYPEDYKKGIAMSGFKDVNKSIVFHAGTAINEGEIVTAGGRVVSLTALGDSIEAAREKAYDDVQKIKFDGAYYRRDIGNDLLKYL